MADKLNEGIDLNETATPAVDEVKELDEAKEPVEQKVSEVQIDKTKLFSERLNKKTEQYITQIKEKEAKVSELEGINKKTEQTLKRLGFKGSTLDELLEDMEATNSGKTVEEIRAERKSKEEEYKRLRDNDPEIQTLKAEAERIRKEKAEIETQQRLKADYEAIKAEYPDIKAKNMDDLIEELGEPFLSKLKKGYEAIDAYETVVKRAKKTPLSTGSTKSSGIAVESDYFTSEELDALTPEQLKDDKIFEKARKSMGRLR